MTLTFACAGSRVELPEFVWLQQTKCNSTAIDWQSLQHRQQRLRQRQRSRLQRQLVYSVRADIVVGISFDFTLLFTLFPSDLSCFTPQQGFSLSPLLLLLLFSLHLQLCRQLALIV